MLIRSPHMTTKLEIWSPKYKTNTVLLAKYKVAKSTPQIIIEFVKAKHLIGQRYAITRNEAVSYPVITNGKTECYNVPMDALERWETPEEREGYS